MSFPVKRSQKFRRHLPTRVYHQKAGVAVMPVLVEYFIENILLDITVVKLDDGYLRLSVISLNGCSKPNHGFHFGMIELVHLFRLDSLGIICIR